jgi:hypothetical protein
MGGGSAKMPTIPAALKEIAPGLTATVGVGSSPVSRFWTATRIDVRTRRRYSGWSLFQVSTSR